jgi:uncharacterized protein
MTVFLVILGFCVGLISGLLGLGGGTVTVPALVFLAPDLGLRGYPMQVATGMSAFLSFFSCLSGAVGHWRRGFIAFHVVSPIIITCFISGLAGTLVSRLIPDIILQLVFAAVLIGILILEWRLPKERRRAHDTEETELPQSPLANDPLALATTAVMSFLVSNIGIGGSVLFIPYLLYVKHVPIRYAIGAGTCFVLVTAMSVIAGKVFLELLPMPDALWLSVSALVGGQLGAMLSHRVPAKWLRRLLMTIIVVTLIRFLIQFAEHLA